MKIPPGCDVPAVFFIWSVF